MAKRILVTEDNQHLRASLVAWLQHFGYETVEAETGAQAIEKAVSDKPNLILMDLNLPDMSGIEAIKEIKTNPTTADIAIIALTASGLGKLRRDTLNAGVIAYLEKPVPMALIIATIEKYLGA